MSPDTSREKDWQRKNGDKKRKERKEELMSRRVLLGLDAHLNRSSRYSITATTCTDSPTSSHSVLWNGCMNESRVLRGISWGGETKRHQTEVR